jgi:hypothetical protein
MSKLSDIGRYSVILDNGALRITNSAILDLDLPYPPMRAVSAEVVHGTPPLDRYTPGWDWFAAASFSDHKVVIGYSLNTSCFPAGPCRAYRTYETYGDSTAPIWQSTFLVGNQDWSPLRPAVINRDGAFVFGYSYRFYFDAQTHDPFYFKISSVDSAGKTNWVYQSPSGFWFRPDREDNLQIVGSGAATVISSEGQQLFSKNMPPTFTSVGRYFTGPSGTNSYIAELDYRPRLTNSAIVGALNLAGHVEWLAELDRPVYSLIGGFETKAGEILAIVGNPVYGRNLAKVLASGEVAWSIPTGGGSDGLEWNIDRLGFATTYDVSANAFTFLSVDHAGTVRTNYLSCAGIENAVRGYSYPAREPIYDARFNPILTYVAPRRYRAALRLSTNAFVGDLKFTSPSNRTYILQFAIPEPDPVASPDPETFRTMNNGEPVTLQASPELPGAVAYQWFFNGQAIISQTGKELTIASFGFADAGQYSVKVRTAYGAATNRVATLGYAGPPALVVARSADPANLVLTWPISAAGFQVQKALRVDGSFSSVTGTMTTNLALSRIEMTTPISEGEVYYRLSKN